MDIVVVRSSQRQSFWTVPFLTAAGLAGIFLFYRGLYPMVAWPLIGIFVVGILVFLMSSGSGEEGRLIINESGILDQSLGIGLIRWRDVMDAHVESKYNNHFICLKLSNPEHYLSQLPE